MIVIVGPEPPVPPVPPFPAAVPLPPVPPNVGGHGVLSESELGWHRVTSWPAFPPRAPLPPLPPVPPVPPVPPPPRRVSTLAPAATVIMANVGVRCDTAPPAVQLDPGPRVAVRLAQSNT